MEINFKKSHLWQKILLKKGLDLKIKYLKVQCFNFLKLQYNSRKYKRQSHCNFICNIVQRTIPHMNLQQTRFGRTYDQVNSQLRQHLFMHLPYNNSI